MERRTVGNIEVIALSDTIQSYPATAVYPAAGAELPAYSAYFDAEGKIALNFGCYLVTDGDTRLLVDTGWGPEYQGQLLGELDAAGVARDTVTHIIFTHLHGDHTGWNLDRATGQPLFPKATYLVPKGDWDHYSAVDPQPSSFTRDVVPLEALGRMQLVSGEHTISTALTAVPTPGHTPGHTSVAITSGSAQGFILGDVVLTRVDAEAPHFESSFDWDKPLAVATRKRILEQLVTSGALVGASHLPVPGFGKFVAKAGGGTRWEAV